jgi:virulence activator alpha
MALRHAVLAALLEGEASGYELAKRFDVSVANFWSATPQQLYRELERLEADGRLRGRVVEHRPDRPPRPGAGQLTLYDRLRDGLLGGRDENAYLRDAERVGPYLTLLGGRMYEQQNIRWCQAVLEILDQRSPQRAGHR